MILSIPDISLFGDWYGLQMYLEKKGNPLYSIESDLNLVDTKIKYLRNLISVGGYLNLYGTPIKSLGDLKSVGGDLYLSYSNIETLGKLTSIDGNLYLVNTPLSKKYSKEKIRNMVEVKGNICL